ncbi:MAG TPA: cytochrome c biogenesis protein CcdA, partial [Candidatus Methylomirabilis sp.]|nr:cytochrome c biogenesis protein CcdA [Candidatus Methylomirabilis sp.]
VLAALMDAINPCAFTLLLIFIASVTAFLQTTQGKSLPETRAVLYRYGSVYIGAIFITYLLLGLGFLKVSSFFAGNHLGSRLAALAAVLLGLWMVKDALLPEMGLRLQAPKRVGVLVQDLARKASLPGMVALGVLVGLCTVPCSGAVYLSILAMLSLQQTFLQAFAYLTLYNFLFVSPLGAILVAASARSTLNRLAHWNLHHREGVRLGMGLGVCILGLIILATV